jgi:hypothetical protein
MKLSLQLSIEEVNVVIAALSELPYKTSSTLIHLIQQQAFEQLKTATPVPLPVQELTTE